MKLWLISQDKNNGYDTYDSAVVAAETQQAAQETLPSEWTKWDDYFNNWVDSPDKVSAILIGEATENTKPGVICASFNAG